ncbi:ATP-grasp domain-containing protein [Streptomyces sp. HC44]|uniref:ATP-grasp domain-containing protein n=1 Tax=Streptomyces scabichelini TaxID=2711217 RepID=A0A6G4VM45_9ACTN|nr:ATP-grasp domain-containing protein [Streptomyces scabichelini]NGO15189.1 ATP-grasp domain-containing protein [Streptomyces scabichelini]
MGSVNIFVLGLDEENLEVLLGVPGAADYRYHPLLSQGELQFSGTPVSDLLDKAERQLREFRGSVDAIVGYWDFPVSMMVPILCRRFGLRSPSLESVVKCEHKYWSRLEQQKAITEYPRFALLDPADPARPPEGVRYPMWVKPVKSYASQLAFRVEDDAQLAAALAEIREGIGQIGKPFEYILRQLDLPPEIAEAGGQTCLAEEEISGAQATVEGYSRKGRIETYGVVDSLAYPGTPSFLRYQYPSALPPHMLRRMEDLSKRVIAQIGLDNSTFCIEFFCHPEGAGGGEVSLLEVNPRHSQSHAELFWEVDGIPNHHCMISLALGKDPRLPHREGPYALAAKCFLRRFRDGRVLHRAGAEEIDRLQQEIPGVDVVPVVDEGMQLSQVPQAHDSYSYELAHIYVGAADEGELQRKYDRCVEALDFRFDDEEGGLCTR